MGNAARLYTPDFAVLHIYGPGDMGKTSLLREFARLAAEAWRMPITLDARRLDASPGGFLTVPRRRYLAIAHRR
ncbi:MAG: hypothetical protein ACK47M_06070 [Caldilinea sp.]